MKKILLLTVMCFFALFGNVKAQETIEVGQSSVLSWSNPIVDYYSYSVCQQIYTAEELQGKAGSINSITFEHGNGAPSTRNIVVYMKNIDKKSFELNNDWVAVSDEDIVYEGEWSLIETTGNVIPMTINLQKNFEYTGGDMLLCMYDKTGVGISSYFNQFYCYYNENYDNRTLYHVDSSSALDMNALSSYNGTRKTFTNYLKLTFTGSGETPVDPTTIAAPQNLTATAAGTTSIALTWDAVDGATGYKVYSGTNVIAEQSTTNYTVNYLTAGTEYCFTVTAFNATEESEASEQACANTNGEGGNEDPEQPTEAVTIEIGEDKGPNLDYQYNLPAYEWSYHAVSQQIYTEEELEGATGNITSVSFKVGNAVSSVVTRKYAVYVKHTELNEFADKDSFVSLSNEDKVYEGNVEISNVANSWLTVNFDTPFKYEGGNIVICVYDKTGSQLGFDLLHNFYKYDVDYNASLNKFNTYNDVEYSLVGLTDANNVLKYKNQIKLTFVPSEGEDPEQPIDPELPIDPEQPADLTTVEIGEDKEPFAANNFYLPVYDFAQYALSQQIYTEEDFEDNLGAIHSVSFKLGNQRDAMVRQYEVYMKHTDLDVFEGAYVTMTEEDKVFDGSVDISGQMDSWYKITFDKPFDYAGGNVVLCVYDKTGVKLQSTYHTFYRYNVEGNRAMYSQGPDPYDFSTLISGQVLEYVNQVRFEVESKSIVKVVPETIDLGEAMLGNYWTEKKAAQTVSVKAVSTTITKIECDNDFFVLPEEIDYTANPVIFEVNYDTNAQVDGEVTGNLIVTYEDGVVEVPMTATAYTPQEGDVFELAKEITLENGKFNDNLTFSELHDNYVMPREVNDGKANDAVYSFEFEEETIIIATVKGTNANLSIYDETFSGKGGPSNDNSFKGSVAVSSDFFYDFNDGFLIDWVAKDYDGDGYSWENTPYYGVDGSNCVISYSSNTTNGILRANNVLMTENTYLITENSQLSFRAQCFDHSQYGVDHVKVEVSKDGETFTFIEEITPGSLTYEYFTIDLGAEFETLGLEYGDYHIALRHQENDKMYVCVDNIQLTNNAKSKTRADEVSIYAVPYPAGKYYAVAAAESDFTFEMMTVNPDELPLAPTNVVATTIDEFSIELTWEASANSTSYNIYRDDEFVANVKELSYTDKNLTHNTDYCYVVKGYNDVLESVPSAKACAKTDKLVLDTPTNVTAVAGSTTTIILSWDAVEKAAGYNIYWGEEIIDIVAETTYTVEGLTPSTEYCYMISAINKDVESYEKSDVVCATTLDLSPSVPTNLKAEATSASSIKLSWTASENAKRYYIYSGDSLVAKTSYTEYNIVKLEPDTEYCYTVTAVNGEIESEPSDEACVKTLGDGIEELSSSINVYPNPVENELFIATEMNVEEVTIYDVYGRETIRRQVNETTSQQVVNVADLNGGVYFVKIVTDNGEIVKRFIKK